MDSIAMRLLVMLVPPLQGKGIPATLGRIFRGRSTTSPQGCKVLEFTKPRSQERSSMALTGGLCPPTVQGQN